MDRHVEVGSARGGGAAVAVAVYDEKPMKLPAGYDALDRRLGGALVAAVARPEFSAAKGTVTTAYPARGASRLYVIGLGARGKAELEALRLGAARVAAAGWAGKIKAVRFELTPGLTEKLDPQAVGRAVGDGLAIAQFDFTEFKGQGRDKKEAKGSAPKLQVQIDRPFQAGLQRALVIGESVNHIRRLAATPPNVANPAYLARHCRQMARRVGLRCTVIDAARARRLGMGGLLAVGAAGSTPPALICLEHKPRGAKGKPILLVGKAVTFDTGGYSIKPADGMDKMKYDKCGGMAVVGALEAAARLKLPVHVVGLLPAAENMVNDHAYRPGDIVRFCNGVTAEITNTDAEGRVILADALAYGTRTYKPRAVIDLATLTGGCIVALGTTAAGCFCADAPLRSRLFDAADFTGERLWHLPLWDEHRQQIRGTHGDIVNAAGREASPIQGAAFLSYFIEPDGKSKLPELPWAHLDIAGVADVKSGAGLFAVGPTGFGVRLLVRVLENWSDA